MVILMSMVDNRGERDYAGKITAIADRLASWRGPIVLIAHADPDGDALGSTLALKRALAALGKETVLPIDPPRYMRFLLNEGELSDALEALPDDALLVVLDAADPNRVWGAPLEGAAFTVNIDHHGTNPRFGDLVVVEPASAATAQIVKDVIDELPVAWTPEIATPCLTGILTDTGSFRYANTDADALAAASDLMRHGVPYAELADRLQWRSHGYFSMLGEVMSTVRFELNDKVVLAALTDEMRSRSGDPDDSDDYVALIRYAEGTYVAVLLKQRGSVVKISMRTRAPASAQAICVELGGGGHVAAAGAKLEPATLDEARQRVLAAVERELARHDLYAPTDPEHA